ncbi:hypothetical protein V6N12_016211 [Hibiscus sabdariffa]|uniref:Uncharacterized protein n=1 Tax=Hibiscus sabdariffa TaxID=183260 RepID=A0ABR2C912_9ROSI
MTVSPAAGVVDCAVVRREESLDKSPEAVVGEVLWRGNDLWCGQEIASDALKPVAREDQLVDVAVDCVGPIAEGSNIEVLVANGCKWKVRLLSDIISSLQMPEEKQQADKAKQRRGRGRPRKGHMKLMKSKWCRMSAEAVSPLPILEKLGQLKGFLKVWNRESFGSVDLQIVVNTELLNDLEGRDDGGVEMLETRRQLQGNLWKLLKYRSSIWRQKSRALWL